MKNIIILISISLMTAFFTGCGSENMQNNIISTDGSSSMEKVIGYLSESYMAENEKVKITYNPTGSGSGINAVLEGRCDIGLSSRDLKDDEQMELIGTVVAIDGIAVIVNPENNIDNLSIEQLSSLYKGEVTNWSELGGSDSPVVLIGREAASGTRDGFESITNIENSCKYSQELTSAGDVIQTVATNPNAIGYTSLSAVKDNVKVLEIEGVIPSKETIQNGSYKIQRDFLFVTRKNTELSDNAKEFFAYVTSGLADDLIEKAGAIPVVR